MDADFLWECNISSTFKKHKSSCLQFPKMELKLALLLGEEILLCFILLACVVNTFVTY